MIVSVCLTYNTNCILMRNFMSAQHIRGGWLFCIAYRSIPYWVFNSCHTAYQIWGCHVINKFDVEVYWLVQICSKNCTPEFTEFDRAPELRTSISISNQYIGSRLLNACMGFPKVLFFVSKHTLLQSDISMLHTKYGIKTKHKTFSFHRLAKHLN